MLLQCCSCFRVLALFKTMWSDVEKRKGAGLNAEMIRWVELKVSGERRSGFFFCPLHYASCLKKTFETTVSDFSVGIC